MFERSYELLSPSQAEHYLHRIGIEALPSTPTLSWLDSVVDRHQCTVPFETIDIHDYHRPISTDLSAIYDKVVVHRRGGYCFELNALFLALLRCCGYDAWPCACRILRGASSLRPVLHRAVMVQLEGEHYFCDVGYGGGAMYPGALHLDSENLQSKGGTTFHVESLDAYWKKLFYHTRPVKGADGQQHPAEVRLEMLVSLYPSTPVDFELPNHYCSTDPASPFVAHRMAYLRRPDGQIALKDMEFSEIQGLRRTSRMLQTEEEVHAVLRDAFGIRA